MCKLSIDNMLWLALMSVIQNKHLPMLESRRYAVRHSQCLCSLCQELFPRLAIDRSLFILTRPVVITGFNWSLLVDWWSIGRLKKPG